MISGGLRGVKESTYYRFSLADRCLWLSPSPVNFVTLTKLCAIFRAFLGEKWGLSRTHATCPIGFEREKRKSFLLYCYFQQS